MDERMQPAFTRRLDGIEGLRGIAAASVLVAHVWRHSQATGAFDIGWLSTYVLPKLAHGVTLFFALSGFLLYLPFAAAALRGEARPSIRAYLRNRAVRILPAYWCILLVTALVLQSAGIHAGAHPGIGRITDPWLLLSNALLIQNYVPSMLNTGISPSWSLAVELVFYAVLPLLVFVGFWLSRRASSRRGRRFMLLVPAMLMMVVGLLSAAAEPVIAGDAKEVWDLAFFPHAHLFAAGMGLAVLRTDYHDGLLRLPRRWRAFSIVATAVVAVIAVKLGVDDRIPEHGEIALMGVACGLLLALVVLHPQPARSWLVASLESSPVVAAGLVSYSVYLWHMPVILFLRKHGLTAGGGAGALLVNLATVSLITGSLSWLSYRYVEKPALRWKARTRSTARVAARSPTPGPAAPSPLDA